MGFFRQRKYESVDDWVNRIDRKILEYLLIIVVSIFASLWANVYLR